MVADVLTTLSDTLEGYMSKKGNTFFNTRTDIPLSGIGHVKGLKRHLDTLRHT